VSAPSLPPGPWDLIYADPPWPMEWPISRNRGAATHYRIMAVDDIAGLGVAGIAAPDSVLFLWATAPKLVEALRVVEAWGFAYRTHLVWDKSAIGMGYWARGRHELLLVAIRGSPRAPTSSRRPDSVLVYPRSNRHSEKPPQVRRLVSRMVPWATRRVELFARGRPPSGWVFWGDQAEPTPGAGGRPRSYHFAGDEARRLRESGLSLRQTVAALGLPDGALRSVRRAISGRGKPPENGGAKRGNVGFAPPSTGVGP
jgi:N6-adenosine-specific RNA methylase IME4